ncbi:MAG: hypothetical protein MMC33_001026 [Icmadophila ericetorum]|nr:hypothetical protein [Icmadophila ericetorum]
MPSRIAAPVVTIDAGKMHKIDIRNVENLFSMWTVFSKCAESMEEGRRLENLSWRIWNRETFCCETQPQFTSNTPTIDVHRPRPSSKDVPELSASVDSVVSEEIEHHQRGSSPLDIKRPAQRKDSLESQTSTGSRGREKHLTSAGLEKMVISIKEKRDLGPLSPSIAEAMPMYFPTGDVKSSATTPASHESQRSNVSASTGLISSPDSARLTNQTAGSDTSAELLSSHSVVRGFSPSNISSSYRSHNHLAPAPVPARSVIHAKTEEQKKKGGMFLLGGSSGEDDSSFEDQMSKKLPPPQSSLTAGLKVPLDSKKQTSFKDEIESRSINHRSQDEDVFEESDDDEDVSESAIEDEDDSDWEDSSSESSESVPTDKHMFPRVPSQPQLVSRRSLLTTLIHQPDRAAALAEMASKSTPALHRSRTSSPNGPSVAASPEDESMLAMPAGMTKSKPITMNPPTINPLCLSPRTTRRNMLATELTPSLRKHLLWERQQKNTTANAVLKRRHTAHVDMQNLQQYPNTSRSGITSRNCSWNNHFDQGLGEYHQAGW